MHSSHFTIGSQQRSQGSESAKNYCTLQSNCQPFQEINEGDIQITRKARIVEIATAHACVTRWGSTLSMLQRLIEQQTAISAVLVEGKDRHLMLESGDWEVVEMLVELLKPFQQATTVMGAVRYPTLSTVKPLLHKLLTKTLKITQEDTATSKAVKQEIKKDLDDRYHKPAVEKIINRATFLDPRYKELPFLDSYSKREIVDMVEEELISLESDGTNQGIRAEEVVGDDDIEPPVSKKKRGPISKLIGDLFEGQNSSGSSTCKASKELELYRAEQPVKDLDSDPLTWWKSRQSVYPLLCQLVKAVHCFVATSVPSERLFSSSGNIISSSRSRLTPEHADQLIFLFENKRKYNYLTASDKKGDKFLMICETVYTSDLYTHLFVT